MAILNDLGSYLDTQLASLTLGTNLFLGRLPDNPDSCVALIEYAGQEPLNVMGSDAMPPVEQPRVQVLSRAANYADAQTLAASVWSALEAVLNETLTSTRYFRVAAVQSLYPLERDSHNRVVFVQNFQVVKAT